MSWPLVKYVLTAALRDKLIISLILLMLVSVSLSFFLGVSAITEKDQFAFVFTGASLRLVGVMALALFAVFYIRRSFEAKDVEFLLSRPLGRVQFILSYAFSFSLLAVFVTFAQGLALYILGPHVFGEGHIFWILSMLMENIIIVNVAFFFAMILQSATVGAMATFGFYILARLMGQLLGIMDAGIGSSLPAFKYLQYMMDAISMVMPRLDLMGQSSWLIYGLGEGDTLSFICTQGIVFTGLVLIATLIDFVLRQF